MHIIVSFHSVSHCLQRGGKDLAKRHARFNQGTLPPQSSALPGKRFVENRRIPVARSFQGLKIPQKPPPLTGEECCMSRCETCVHDLYIMSLQRYHQDLRELRKTLSEMQLSHQEWPMEIRTDGTQSEDTVDKEQLAATDAAQRAFWNMKQMEETQSWRTRVLCYEVMKLLVWILKGCRG